MKRKIYRDMTYWKKYMNFLPEEMRMTDNKQPDEEWWDWRGNSIHLDIMRNPSSKYKFIILHGGGGYGRLLSTYGTFLNHQGYEYIAPDLPGFGLTIASKKFSTDYRYWVELVSDLIDKEIEHDSRPVILFGASIGGMLTYHVACKNNIVKGIIATCLADSRTAIARDALARNKFWSRAGFIFMSYFPFILNLFSVNASWISKMKFMTDDPAFSKIFINDPLSGKSKISLKFYKTMTEYNPGLEPEFFHNCPVLLIHPGNDNWTPVEISKYFFDRIASSDKEYVIIEGASHYPYKKSEIKQMRIAIKKFLG